MKCSKCSGEEPKVKNNGCCTPRVLQVESKEAPVLFHRIDVPASLGDDDTNPPIQGKYKNILLVYEANNHAYLYDSDGIYTYITGAQGEPGTTVSDEAILGYNTVAAMKSAKNLVNGSFAMTYGFHTKGDGGSAKYKIRKITNTDVVDEMTIIALSNQSLVAELVMTGEIKPEQLGAKGDNSHDDTAALAKLVSIKGVNIELVKDKVYLFNSTLNIVDNIYLNGNNSTLHYTGTGTAINVTSTNPTHSNDGCNINNMTINAENSDKVINWDGGIKALVRNVKIYNFSHYGIYFANPGYESRFENIYFACKKLPNTIAICGSLADMDFGALYGVNAKTFMKVTNCATNIELIHAWTANIALFDEEEMTDEEYDEWYNNTVLINFNQGPKAFPINIKYLYADTYHDIFYYQTYHRSIYIDFMSFRGSTNIVKFDNDYEYYVFHIFINDLDIEPEDMGLLETTAIHPNIAHVRGQKTTKVRTIEIGTGNNVDVPVDEIIPYTQTVTGEYTMTLSNVVPLPGTYSVDNYGGNAKSFFPFVPADGSFVIYNNGGDVPTGQYSVRLYLKAKPIKRGDAFKYAILEQYPD